jgi:hypothetical protein
MYTDDTGAHVRITEAETDCIGYQMAAALLHSASSRNPRTRIRGTSAQILHLMIITIQRLAARLIYCLRLIPEPRSNAPIRTSEPV